MSEQELTLPKASKQPALPEAIIRTEEDFKKLLAFENGKYCIVMNHTHVAFQNSPFFNKIEADSNFHHLVRSLQTIYKNPDTLEEQIDAQNNLVSIYVEPYRVH